MRIGAVGDIGISPGTVVWRVRGAAEIRVSVIVSEDQINDAVAAAHSRFDLDADEVEAVVYGGTGR